MALFAANILLTNGDYMEQDLFLNSVIEVKIAEIAGEILERRLEVAPERSVLAAITGIDGCGKGHLSERLREVLADAGLRVGVIGIDGWLNLPHKRFSERNPAEHFYLHAIRFKEMFTQFVLPLRDKRSIILEADFAEETATSYRKHLYNFENLDIILLEGIYLLKREFQGHYDLSIWIDCTFETALERVVSRGQEGLPPEETIRAYQRIYFPAQEIHFAKDNPRQAATITINNDPHLELM